MAARSFGSIETSSSSVFSLCFNQSERFTTGTGESGEALSASFPVVTTSSRYGYSFWTFNIAFQRSVRGTKRILASELFRMKALEEGVSTAWRGTGTIPWERMLRSQAVAVMELGRRTAAWSPFFNPKAVKALRQLRTISANSFQVTPIHVLDLSLNWR